MSEAVMTPQGLISKRLARKLGFFPTAGAGKRADLDPSDRKETGHEGATVDGNGKSDEIEMHGHGAVAAGRRRERGRCAAIIGRARAGGNVELACKLAFETSLPRQEAIDILAAAKPTSHEESRTMARGEFDHLTAEGAERLRKEEIQAGWDRAIKAQLGSVRPADADPDDQETEGDERSLGDDERAGKGARASSRAIQAGWDRAITSVHGAATDGGRSGQMTGGSGRLLPSQRRGG